MQVILIAAKYSDSDMSHASNFHSKILLFYIYMYIYNFKYNSFNPRIKEKEAISLRRKKEEA